MEIIGPGGRENLRPESLDCQLPYQLVLNQNDTEHFWVQFFHLSDGIIGLS